MIKEELKKKIIFLFNQKKIDELITYLFNYLPAQEINDNAEIYALIGKCYFEKKQYDISIIYYLKAIEINKTNHDAYYSIGNSYLKKKKYFLALQNFIKTLKFKKNFYPALTNIAYILKICNKLLMADKIFKEIYKNNPDYVLNLWNYSQLLLKQKKYKLGFKYYECRWNHKNLNLKYFFSNLVKPDNPEDLKNESIVIFEEQGHGDQIQFIRYLSLFHNSTKVFYYTKKNMHKILGYKQKYICTDDVDYINKNVKFALPIMSLPFFFKMYEFNQGHIPYLYTDLEKDNYWRKKIESSKVKIGFCNNVNFKNNNERSININLLVDILKIPDFTFISLMKCNDELKNLNEIKFFKDIDLKNSYEDTASIIKNLDAVLTVDTSVAHLAGALGIKTFLMLNEEHSDWRWGTSKNETSWYKDFFILRKNRLDKWQDFIFKIKSTLINNLNC